MKEKRTHGVLSLILFVIAILIAMYAVVIDNFLFGLIYMLFLPIGAFIALLGFCPKCPHVTDRSCRHVIPGEIVRLFSFNNKDGQYRIANYLILIVPMALIIGIPQIFLFRQGVLWFVVFWGIMAIIALEIVTFVCRSCKNTNCPAYKYRTH
jgi:hypothetical protein